jgi:HK97 family phage major capsid protein
MAAVAAAQGQGQGGQPSEVRQLVGELVQAHQDFKTKHDERLDYIQASFDDLTRRVSAIQINGGGAPDAMPEDPQYSRLFATWFRNGAGEHELREANASGERARVQAALSVGDNSNGGFLAPVEWDRKVSRALVATSPLRRLCTVITTSTAGYSTLYTDDSFGSGWVGEVASRPDTTNAQFSSLTFMSGEIYAQPVVTQQLLDDSALNMEAWLAERVAFTFGQQEALAFLSGNGVNKPWGLLPHAEGGAAATRHPSGAIKLVNTGAASAITGDGFIDLVYSLPAPYRQGAVFLMNSATAAGLHKLKDGQGNYLWYNGYALGQPQTLLGYPIEIDENMPSVAAGNIPVVFGNFRIGYTINDRMGMRVLKDPYTSKPFVKLYCTKRVGGGVQDPNAFRFLRVSA